MQVAEPLKAQQQAAELVLPAEHPLDGMEPLLENSGIEEWLAASFGSISATRIRIDVGNHRAVENGFAILAAIVDAIQADDGSCQIQADRLRHARDLRQRLSQQRRLIAIARSRNKRCDHIAIAIAEGDDFIAFDFLVAAEAEVVAALLRCRGCAIPMDDADVQMIMFLQRRYRPNENGVQTTVRLPPAKGAVNARIVDFRTALLIFFDRQFLPLTPEVKRLQDVVEDRVQAQIRLWPTAPPCQMRQDKLLELFQTQMRWNALPARGFRHFYYPGYRM